jgi:hypothetical protein
MTDVSHPRGPVITAAEAARMRAAAAAQGTSISVEAVVTGAEPGLIDRIASALFPWLDAAEAEPEAGL